MASVAVEPSLQTFIKDSVLEKFIKSINNPYKNYAEYVTELTKDHDQTAKESILIPFNTEINKWLSEDKQQELIDIFEYIISNEAKLKDLFEKDETRTKRYIEILLNSIVHIKQRKFYAKGYMKFKEFDSNGCVRFYLNVVKPRESFKKFDPVNKLEILIEQMTTKWWSWDPNFDGLRGWHSQPVSPKIILETNTFGFNPKPRAYYGNIQRSDPGWYSNSKTKTQGDEFLNEYWETKEGKIIKSFETLTIKHQFFMELKGSAHIDQENLIINYYNDESDLASIYPYFSMNVPQDHHYQAYLGTSDEILSSFEYIEYLSLFIGLILIIIGIFLCLCLLVSIIGYLLGYNNNRNNKKTIISGTYLKIENAI